MTAKTLKGTNVKPRVDTICYIKPLFYRKFMKYVRNRGVAHTQDKKLSKETVCAQMLNLIKTNNSQKDKYCMNLLIYLK